jgi:hypothetical protein
MSTSTSSVLISACLLLLSQRVLAASSKGVEASPKSHASRLRNSSSLPEDVKGSLACLFADPWDELQRLVNRPERSVVVRFSRGALPGWPRETGTETLNLTIYSTRQDEAVLLFTEPQGDRRTLVIDNGYTLVKGPLGWEAGEGNGGVATYKAVGKYADGLDRARSYTIVPKKLPRDGECEWLGTGKRMKLEFR